jgi:hypothetical protein
MGSSSIRRAATSAAVAGILAACNRDVQLGYDQRLTRASRLRRARILHQWLLRARFGLTAGLLRNTDQT